MKSHSANKTHDKHVEVTLPTVYCFGPYSAEVPETSMKTTRSPESHFDPPREMFGTEDLLCRSKTLHSTAQRFLGHIDTKNCRFRGSYLFQTIASPVGLCQDSPSLLLWWDQDIIMNHQTEILNTMMNTKVSEDTLQKSLHTSLYKRSSFTHLNMPHQLPARRLLYKRFRL